MDIAYASGNNAQKLDIFLRDSVNDKNPVGFGFTKVDGKAVIKVNSETPAD